jgi:hypothetical protein
MNPTTRKYLHALEFAVLGGMLPVINNLVQSQTLDWHTALKSLIAAALTAAWAFLRSNPPPVGQLTAANSVSKPTT